MEHQSNKASHNYADVIQDIKDIFQRRNDELNAVIKKLQAPTESDQVAEIDVGTLKRNIVSPEAIHKYAEMIISTANAVGLKPSQIRDLPADIDNTIRNEPIAQPLESIIHKIKHDMHTELHQALRSGKTGEAEALIDRLLKEDPEQLKGKNYLQFAVKGHRVAGESLEMHMLFPRRSFEPEIHSVLGYHDPNRPSLGYTDRISNAHIEKLVQLSEIDEVENAYKSLRYAHGEHRLQSMLGKILDEKKPAAVQQIHDAWHKEIHGSPAPSLGLWDSEEPTNKVDASQIKKAGPEENLGSQR